LKRREFLRLTTAGLAAWPLALRAQQPAIPLIGVLAGGSPEADAFRITAVKEGLAAIGYVENQNVAIEYRWAYGHYERLPGLVAELIDRRVAVIVALNNAPASAARAESACFSM